LTVVVQTTIVVRVMGNAKGERAVLRGLCLEEDVFVNLLRTADALVRATEGVLKAAEVLPTQYNVLRILRGSPAGLPCSEIAKRMISRDPDMTRLLDRMERRELISRERATADRRVVVTKITSAGQAVLARLDPPVKEIHQRMLGHLGAKRLESLGELLRAARERAAQETNS
jgi:DNA-binding MarR family transcriptional regulator